MDLLHVVRLFTMTGIWIVLFFLIRLLDKKFRYIFFIYFGILTIIFISGYVYYFVSYDLYASPMPDEVIDFGNWVYTFSILFVIPFVFLLLAVLYRFVKHFPRVQQVILCVIAIINAVILSYILMLLFMLVFYGFAP